MRIVVHDYVGYAFPAQLARSLAGRGHDVLHLHCRAFVAGKGRLERTENDPPGLAFDSVGLDEEFAKYDIPRRIAHERATGRELAAGIAAFGPDVVLSANTPLIVQRALLRATHAAGARFVFWQQDVISAAAKRVAGPAAGWAAGLLERRLVRRSDAVVVISEDFLPLLRRWGVDESRVTVVENWAPVEELPVVARANSWSAEHGLDEHFVLLYSGALGIKHDPSLLLYLARWAAGHGALVVVVSEGPGADWLAEHGAAEDALRLLPYQPYERLPEMLGSADVLVALLDPAAAGFSVPSKVLTYLCAGRPLLLSVGRENLAARVVERSGGGVVVPASDSAALVGAAEELRNDAERRAELGRSGRAYAESAFDRDAIAVRFEQVLEEEGQPARRRRRSTPPSA
ncbi:MAG TPA: glycosyltransferase family 4 protein [Gaiellaceae bacterium]|nr:glycosyltransferase family 4 protein [Gaiellaceae bacterium]